MCLSGCRHGTWRPVDSCISCHTHTPTATTRGALINVNIATAREAVVRDVRSTGDILDTDNLSK